MAICLLFLVAVCCNLIRAQDSLLNHTEVIKIKRAEGDAVLEAFAPRMFERYSNLTYQIYKDAFKSGEKEKWKQIGFVCINPSARTYGGMGNLLLSMIGVEFFGMALGRTVIVNNALITDMFTHPDSRQKFAPLSNQLINHDMKKIITSIEAKKLTERDLRHFKSKKYIGSHGAPTLTHGFKTFTPSLPQLLPNKFKMNKENEVFYHNVMCQGYVSWLFSRPTKRIQVALSKYKGNFLNKCDAGNVPDIAIQVRTRDEAKIELNSTKEDCYIACAVKKARAVYKELNRSVCVFVTSNRVSTTDSVVDKLNSILNSDTSSPFKFLYHQVSSSTSTEVMHSGKMVEAGRHVESFPDSNDFSLKEDLMDWFLLGEAVHVVGSHESTFLSTARLRIGNPARHVFNPLQHDVSPNWSAKTNFQCICEVRSKACN